MKALIVVMLFFSAIICLQGCATSSGSASDASVMSYQNREVIASPAARLSADSGAMHTGMSGVGQ